MRTSVTVSTIKIKFRRKIRICQAWRSAPPAQSADEIAILLPLVEGSAVEPLEKDRKLKRNLKG